jgi:ABC-type oligopeptide transport system substrate-binding subunit
VPKAQSSIFFQKEEVFTMLKKIIALLLCLLMMIPFFSSCAKRDENDLGPVISMYLSDEIYNFDPAYAYYNASARNIVSLLFETLFKLDSDGKIQNGLVDEYEYIENPSKDEYKLVMTLKNTSWSNRDPVTTENVLYAWKRLLSPNNSFEAASLLFDIKNARAAKEGDVSSDDIGVEASSLIMLTVYFEGPIDLDAFLLTLTSSVQSTA